MAQCLKGIFGIGLLVLLVWPSYSVEANTFTLEQLQEQLQGLTENYIKFKQDTETKYNRLEAKEVYPLFHRSSIL
ncbi:hypothetical protein DAPPUDRAFT_320582 [Daphnia pulex]|uniref:Prolyl 4-hydroxylase alpha-subunit N-terminal domain-containing protein n=1 Tax=Daphnia pulex TaxID=6669 RepID=E9GQI3_DAPPU|nr:hypothetical protein DAPPUDRAFT_320582 [Daphnia pulex]|eukprot:EFX78328.1 hypothetical protein DAPPUDRAFT_320582 [Daphnia pulex]